MTAIPVKKGEEKNSMKIGVVGSRDLFIDEMYKYIPSSCEKIISGGAIGIDECAAKYAKKQGIKLVEILPDYKKYGKAAPVLRNKTIADESDIVIAFWDGHSKGTRSIIDYCKKTNKICTVVKMLKNDVESNMEKLTPSDLDSTEKKIFVLKNLTKLYSDQSFEIIENAPDIFVDLQHKLKLFSDRKKGIIESEISIEDLSASINIVLPLLLLSKEDVNLLNDIQDLISAFVVMSYHNRLKIAINVPYFTDKESPYVRAWKRINDEYDKNNINYGEGL